MMEEECKEQRSGKKRRRERSQSRSDAKIQGRNRRQEIQNIDQDLAYESDREESHDFGDASPISEVHRPPIEHEDDHEQEDVYQEKCEIINKVQHNQ